MCKYRVLRGGAMCCGTTRRGAAARSSARTHTAPQRMRSAELMPRSARAHYTTFTLYYGARDFYLIFNVLWVATVGAVMTNTLHINTSRETNNSTGNYTIIPQNTLNYLPAYTSLPCVSHGWAMTGKFTVRHVVSSHDDQNDHLAISTQKHVLKQIDSLLTVNTHECSKNTFYVGIVFISNEYEKMSESLFYCFKWKAAKNYLPSPDKLHSWLELNIQQI